MKRIDPDLEIAGVLTGKRRWCVLNADCRRALELIPDPPGVAHVITDPPYSADLYARTRTNRGNREFQTPNDMRSRMQLHSNRIGAIDDLLDPVAEQILRIANRWIVVFHDAEIGHRWREAFGPAYVRAGVWVKPDPVPQISGDRPGQGFEAITIAHRRGRKRWNGGGRPAVWTHGTCKGAERPDHPCPKPLGLMVDLVRDFTDPDDVIVDPFCGSGTTGVAAVRLGRRFIGIDRDRTFASMARERIAAEAEGATVAEFRARARQIPMLEVLNAGAGGG